MLLGILGASLLGKLLISKGTQIELVKARLKKEKAQLEQDRIFNTASSFK